MTGKTLELIHPGQLFAIHSIANNGNSYLEYLSGMYPLNRYRQKGKTVDVRRACRNVLMYEIVNNCTRILHKERCAKSGDWLRLLNSWFDSYAAGCLWSNLDYLIQLAADQEYEAWVNIDLFNNVVTAIIPNPGGPLQSFMRNQHPATKKFAANITIPVTKVLLPLLAEMQKSGVPWYPALNGELPKTRFKDGMTDYSENFDWECAA